MTEQIYPPITTPPEEPAETSALHDGIAGLVWLAFFIALAIAPALVYSTWKALL